MVIEITLTGKFRDRSPTHRYHGRSETDGDIDGLHQIVERIRGGLDQHNPCLWCDGMSPFDVESGLERPQLIRAGVLCSTEDLLKTTVTRGARRQIESLAKGRKVSFDLRVTKCLNYPDRLPRSLVRDLVKTISTSNLAWC